MTTTCTYLQQLTQVSDVAHGSLVYTKFRKASKLKYTKGHNSVKNVGGVTILAHCLVLLYICTKFHENISKGFRVIERTQFPN